MVSFEHGVVTAMLAPWLDRLPVGLTLKLTLPEIAPRGSRVRPHSRTFKSVGVLSNLKVNVYSIRPILLTLPPFCECLIVVSNEW
jgi:hypothetical protein